LCCDGRAIEAGNIDFETVQRFPDQYTQFLYAAVHKFKEKTRTPTP